MTAMDLMLAFGEVDDRYVQMPRPCARKTAALRQRGVLVAAAACAAVVLGGGLYVWTFTQTDAAVVYPTCNVQASELTEPLSSQLCLFPLSTQDVLAKSEAVVVADVKSVEIENAFVSHVRLSVKEVLHGAVRCKDEISVHEIVLYKDTANTEEYGTPDGGLRMEEGNRVLLFLKEGITDSAHGEGTVYELADGYFCKYFFDADGRYHLSASYGKRVLSSDIVALLRDYKPRTAEEYKELFSLQTGATQVTKFDGRYAANNASPSGEPYLYLYP
ncbi:MAG: hypothetical protein IJD01_00470 [Clostridia bacterium]|nr:hypothetical protein [Clostridia bacterium]